MAALVSADLLNADQITADEQVTQSGKILRTHCTLHMGPALAASEINEPESEPPPGRIFWSRTTGQACFLCLPACLLNAHME
jgi:hypothetical protein